jgi:hypothetical protein
MSKTLTVFHHNDKPNKYIIVDRPSKEVRLLQTDYHECGTLISIVMMAYLFDTIASGTRMFNDNNGVRTTVYREGYYTATYHHTGELADMWVLHSTLLKTKLGNEYEEQ